MSQLNEDPAVFSGAFLECPASAFRQTAGHLPVYSDFPTHDGFLLQFTFSTILWLHRSLTLPVFGSF
jgi:hypothetical protein